MEMGSYDITLPFAFLWFGIGLILAIDGFKTRKNAGYGLFINIPASVLEFVCGPITLTHKYG